MILFFKIKDMLGFFLKRIKEDFVKNCMFVLINIERQYLYFYFCILLKNCRKSYDMSMYYFCFIFDFVVLFLWLQLDCK